MVRPSKGRPGSSSRVLSPPAACMLIARLGVWPRCRSHPRHHPAKTRLPLPAGPATVGGTPRSAASWQAQQAAAPPWPPLHTRWPPPSLAPPACAPRCWRERSTAWRSGWAATCCLRPPGPLFLSRWAMAAAAGMLGTRARLVRHLHLAAQTHPLLAFVAAPPPSASAISTHSIPPPSLAVRAPGWRQVPRRVAGHAEAGVRRVHLPLGRQIRRCAAPRSRCTISIACAPPGRFIIAFALAWS